jgi:hypothetical protein
MELLREHLVGVFIAIAIAFSLLQILLRMKKNDPAKMQMLNGRESISDEEFHTRYYPDVPQMLITATRILFARRAGVPHKLLLPTDRLADFGIQEHANEVMVTIQKQPGYDAVTMPVTRVETLDDIIKMERWAVEQRANAIKKT